MKRCIRYHLLLPLLMNLAVAACSGSDRAGVLSEPAGCKTVGEVRRCDDSRSNIRITFFKNDWSPRICGEQVRVTIFGSTSDDEAKEVVAAVASTYEGYTVTAMQAEGKTPWVRVYNGCEESSFGPNLALLKGPKGWAVESRPRW